MTQAAQALQNSSENRPNFKLIPGKKNFTQMSNSARYDIIRNAGHIAFAIFEHMVSKDINWEFYPKEIAKGIFVHSNTVYKYLNKLIKLGYVSRKQVRDERGCYGKCVYQVFQEPIFLKEETQHTETPHPTPCDTATISSKNKEIRNNNKLALDNNLLPAQSVPKARAEESVFEVEEKKAVIDVGKIRAVVDAVPDSIKEQLSKADRKRVVGLLKTYQGYSEERLKEIVLYAIGRGKGCGYLETCLKNDWPEKRKKRNDYVHPADQVTDADREQQRISIETRPARDREFMLNVLKKRPNDPKVIEICKKMGIL